jgi:hypothetical protein
MELVRTALAAPPLAGVEPVPSIAVVVVVAPSRAQQHRVVAVRAAVVPVAVDRWVMVSVRTALVALPLDGVGPVRNTVFVKQK